MPTARRLSQTLGVTKFKLAQVERRGGSLASTCGKIWLPVAMSIAIYVNFQVGSDAYITLGVTKFKPASVEGRGGSLASTCGKIWLLVAMSIATYGNLQVGSDAYITLGLTNTARAKPPKKLDFEFLLSSHALARHQKGRICHLSCCYAASQQPPTSLCARHLHTRRIGQRTGAQANRWCAQVF